MAVTLLMLNRFKKYFFTVRFSSKFAAKNLFKDPTAPHMRRYTTL